MVEVQILSEKLGVGPFADARSSEEEEELLLAAREVSEEGVGCSKHDICNKSYQTCTPHILQIHPKICFIQTRMLHKIITALLHNYAWLPEKIFMIDWLS